MTTSPQPDVSVEWISDKVDLDELFGDAKRIGDGSDCVLPEFFASDEEFAEFKPWLKAERAAGTARDGCASSSTPMSRRTC